VTGGGEGDNRVVFWIGMLKNEVSETYYVLYSNLERKFTKSQIYYLNFEIKFQQRAKGNSGEVESGPRVIYCSGLLYRIKNWMLIFHCLQTLT
jgi:hypothetical protein